MDVLNDEQAKSHTRKRRRGKERERGCPRGVYG